MCVFVGGGGGKLLKVYLEEYSEICICFSDIYCISIVIFTFLIISALHNFEQTLYLRTYITWCFVDGNLSDQTFCKFVMWNKRERQEIIWINKCMQIVGLYQKMFKKTEKKTNRISQRKKEFNIFFLGFYFPFFF